MPTECAELLLYAEEGSFSISAKFKADMEEVVDTDPFCPVLPPKLPVLLCAESSLLPPPAEGICSGGSLLLFCAASCGVWAVPMGVARLSLGGCWRCGMDKGGMAEFSDMGGAAELLTARWWGEAGMDRPRRGNLGPLCWRPPPGTGGRNKGTGEGEDMLASEGRRDGRSGRSAWSAMSDSSGRRLSKRCSRPSLTACRGGRSGRLRPWVGIRSGQVSVNGLKRGAVVVGLRRWCGVEYQMPRLYV